MNIRVLARLLIGKYSLFMAAIWAIKVFTHLMHYTRILPNCVVNLYCNFPAYVNIKSNHTHDYITKHTQFTSTHNSMRDYLLIWRNLNSKLSCRRGIKCPPKKCIHFLIARASCSLNTVVQMALFSQALNEINSLYLYV